MADPNQRIDSIIKKLKESSHKLTPQRLAVVKILAHSQGHPNVEQIYEQIKSDFPTMSLATVYRNVMLLKSLGEILELGFPDGSNRYDGNKPYPHPHVICIKCKKVIDPDLDSLKDMTSEIAAETGFKIVTHRLDFFGFCQDCMNQ
ncbi:MAG: transcriptional repressor [Desulfobacterales bacterium]|jgi:Fur family peroxide stress response transcriptional regulator|nr:transcriptional repressor [Desulfobacterales bacterium]